MQLFEKEVLNRFKKYSQNENRDRYDIDIPHQSDI